LGRTLGPDDFTDCLLNTRGFFDRPLTYDDYLADVAGPVPVPVHRSERLIARLAGEAVPASR